MTVVKKPSRNIFNPINVIIGLVTIVLLFEGFSITTSNLHTAQNQELINIAIKQNAEQEQDAAGRSKLATEERATQIGLSTDIKKIIEAQGNLTAQNRAGLLTAINTTYYETIPEINQALQKIVNAQPQSNFTAQKIAIANIEKVLENQEKILQKLNGTIQ